MTYDEALELVKEEYETKRITDNCYKIKTGLTYDGCRGFSVTLYTDGEEIILSDLGNTKEVFDEVDAEEWEELCESHGFEFNRYRIIRRFSSTDDVYQYIKFLDFVSDKFFPLDD